MRLSGPFKTPAHQEAASQHLSYITGSIDDKVSAFPIQTDKEYKLVRSIFAKLTEPNTKVEDVQTSLDQIENPKLKERVQDLAEILTHPAEEFLSPALSETSEPGLSKEEREAENLRVKAENLKVIVNTVHERVRRDLMPFATDEGRATIKAKQEEKQAETERSRQAMVAARQNLSEAARQPSVLDVEAALAADFGLEVRQSTPSITERWSTASLPDWLHTRVSYDQILPFIEAAPLLLQHFSLAQLQRPTTDEATDSLLLKLDLIVRHKERFADFLIFSDYSSQHILEMDTALFMLEFGLFAQLHPHQDQINLQLLKDIPPSLKTKICTDFLQADSLTSFSDSTTIEHIANVLRNQISWAQLEQLDDERLKILINNCEHPNYNQSYDMEFLLTQSAARIKFALTHLPPLKAILNAQNNKLSLKEILDIASSANDQTWTHHPSVDHYLLEHGVSFRDICTINHRTFSSLEEVMISSEFKTYLEKDLKTLPLKEVLEIYSSRTTREAYVLSKLGMPSWLIKGYGFWYDFKGGKSLLTTFSSKQLQEPSSAKKKETLTLTLKECALYHDYIPNFLNSYHLTNADLLSMPPSELRIRISLFEFAQSHPTLLSLEAIANIPATFKEFLFQLGPLYQIKDLLRSGLTLDRLIELQTQEPEKFNILFKLFEPKHVHTFSQESTLNDLITNYPPSQIAFYLEASEYFDQTIARTNVSRDEIMQYLEHPRLLEVLKSHNTDTLLNHGINLVQLLDMPVEIFNRINSMNHYRLLDFCQTPQANPYQALIDFIST